MQWSAARIRARGNKSERLADTKKPLLENPEGAFLVRYARANDLVCTSTISANDFRSVVVGGCLSGLVKMVRSSDTRTWQQV